MLQAAQRPRNRGRRGARVKNQHLAIFHLLGSTFGDAQLFLAVKLFFFTQRRIFQCALARGQRSPVCAMHQSLRVEDFEILANRNLRGFVLGGQLGDEYPSLMRQLVENSAAAFFVEHGIYLVKL